MKTGSKEEGGMLNFRQVIELMGCRMTRLKINKACLDCESCKRGAKKKKKKSIKGLL